MRVQSSHGELRPSSGIETGAFDYWGKAQGFRASEPSTHPLLWHMMDVGACAQALLDVQPMRRAALGTLLGMTEPETRALVGYLAALHDIGKLAVGFQRKVPMQAPHALKDLPQTGPRCDHTVEGAALLREFPPEEIFTDTMQGHAITDAIAGHHGRPVRDIHYRDRTFGAPGLHAYREICATLKAIYEPPILPHIEKGDATSVAWRLAGLTNLADWLGSDRERFPYTPPCAPQIYARLVAFQAEKAVAAAGLQEAPGENADPVVFLPEGKTPRPMQVAAMAVNLGDGPTLFIVEDVTGSGKTEAAAILTSRLIAANRANGAFFALPTMATANAMFERMRGGHRAFFASGSTPSLALAHGRAALMPGFAEGADAQGASADCAAWFAKETRRALLADIGIGTIDQALLAALPSRFQALRLYGLADKVMILDEVHAYDPYMIAGIEKLLAFHSMMGGSAILLSATLPQEMRARLERVWTGGKTSQPSKEMLAATMGLSVPIPAPEGETPIPLLSVSSSGKTVRQPISAAPGSARRVQVDRVASVAEGEAAIVDAAARGAACLYIRNSVDDARETVAALREAGVDAVLFHARFAMGDRLAIEGAVLRTFGKSGVAADRAGRVLVATQVVEQSLDLDFDVMVSDLAPLDLLIQRAGRLRRHDWPDRPIGDAPLRVVSPDWRADRVEAGWPRPVLPRTAAVYRNDALLWRSARALFEAGEIATPSGTRALVEAVYGARAETVPPVLERREIEAEGETRAHRSIGAQTFLDPAEGYTWSRDPVTDGRAPTRLGEETRVVRLARWQEGALVPWAGGDVRHAWALSEVSVGPWVLAGVPPPSGPLAGVVDCAKREWGAWEAETMLLLPLERDGEGWHGVALDAAGSVIDIAYSSTDGLSRRV